MVTIAVRELVDAKVHHRVGGEGSSSKKPKKSVASTKEASRKGIGLVKPIAKATKRKSA